MSWRNRLRPAFFRAVPFHVDESELSGGRRVAPHEYPNRNTGYVEDMGRRMRAYRVRGYVVGPNFDIQARLLTAALEADGPGLMILPLIGEDLVVVANFSQVTTREEGGYATIDMDFLQAGTPVSAAAATNTGEAVTTAANGAASSVADSPMEGIGGP